MRPSLGGRVAKQRYIGGRGSVVEQELRAIRACGEILPARERLPRLVVSG
jgi:hypothetical protein